jgi:hypothetical protein
MFPFWKKINICYYDIQITRDLVCPRVTFRLLGYQVIGKSEVRILIVMLNNEM